MLHHRHQASQYHLEEVALATVPVIATATNDDLLDAMLMLLMIQPQPSIVKEEEYAIKTKDYCNINQTRDGMCKTTEEQPTFLLFNFEIETC